MNRRDNAAYLRFVAAHDSCLGWPAPMRPSPGFGAFAAAIPGRYVKSCPDVVAHHVRRGMAGGVGLKPSDYRAVPLTDSEHRELHQNGEASFWYKHGVDPDTTIVALLRRYAALVAVLADETLYRDAPASALIDIIENYRAIRCAPRPARSPVYEDVEDDI